MLSTYFTEILERWNGHAPEPELLSTVMAGAASDTLGGTTGRFYLARREGRVVGCGGIRFVQPDLGEFTRIFTLPEARGRGVGAAIVGHLESVALENARPSVRLDTRDDLVEARRLYTRLGYRPISAYNTDPYAHHWFGKNLR